MCPPPLCAEVVPCMVYHACETHGVCFHGGEFYGSVQLTVLLAYTAYVQIDVHSAKLPDEPLQEGRCIGGGNVNLSIRAVAKFGGDTLQVLLASSRYGHGVSISVKQASHFQTYAGGGSHYDNPFLHSGFFESMVMVTGPSLVRATCMSAPKRPVGMSRPRAMPSWRTKYS